MGFGTGLNAFLTGIAASRFQKKMEYTTLETDPLRPEEAVLLNYTATLQHQELYTALHASPWNEVVPLTEYFSVRKENTSLLDFPTQNTFHLIYYDACAPAAQPELWTQEVFEKLWSLLEPMGVLVTYCSKGSVRRAMLAAGFQVTKIPGPPGQREMLRAEKPQG